MVEIDIPADPAPNGYVPNPYEEELKQAYEYVKRETDSTDGWSRIGVHNLFLISASAQRQ